MDTKLLKQVNDLLARELGQSMFDLPNFRVIWSTGETEKRLGTFSDYYGKIFIRCVTEVRTVLKYPNDQDRFILERIQSAVGNPELTADYSYEPIYVFKDKRGFHLPLNMRVIEFFIKRIKEPPDAAALRTQMEDEILKEEEREVAEFLDILHDVGRSPLFAYEDSVFMDSTKRKVD
jgi:hypothetical protein